MKKNGRLLRSAVNVREDFLLLFLIFNMFFLVFFIIFFS